MELYGYHGTDAKAGLKILEEQNINPSEGPDEWLGKGRYFFTCLQDAEWWCDAKRFTTPIVIVGELKFTNKVIDLVNNRSDQELFFQYSKKVERMCENLPPPHNRKRRNYMQLAIEKLLEEARKNKILIDASIAIFNQNRKFWEFKDKERWKFPCYIGQVQVCVYNPKSIIKLYKEGYRDERKILGYNV